MEVGAHPQYHGQDDAGQNRDAVERSFVSTKSCARHGGRAHLWTGCDFERIADKIRDVIETGLGGKMDHDQPCRMKKQAVIDIDN